MKLIRLLQEASSLSLADIKKAMLKDAKVASVFKQNFSILDIDDVSSFLSSLKFYVFNNSNVMDFVDTRHNIKNINKVIFDDLRRLQSKDLTQQKLQEIQDFLTDLFKEHTSVKKGVMSPFLKKELANWMDAHTRYHDLSKAAMTELKANPNFRQDKKMVVYRGVLFSENDLKAREKYDGTLEIGNGLKFLKSIRKGSKAVDLSWERPSSWTTDKEIAERFAKFGPAGSQFAAMSQWFDRQSDKREIDGDLGFVISTLVNPEDVLLDSNVINKNLASRDYGESEVILAPGTYLAKIVKKFNVQGEVDPLESPENALTSVVVAIKEGLQNISVPEQYTTDEYLKMNSGFSAGIKPFKSKSITRMLVTAASTTTALHLHDKLNELYKKSGLTDLKTADFSADNFQTDDEIHNADILRVMFKTSHTKVKHSNKEHHRKDLSATDFRTTLKHGSFSVMERSLLTSGTIHRDAMYEFGDCARAVGVVLPSTFYQMGATKQKPFIDATVKGILDLMGLPFTESSQDNYKAFINYTKKLIRNYNMIQDSMNQISKLKGLK